MFSALIALALMPALSLALQAWHMQDLGLQTVQAVLESRDPLRRLRDISQNFPQHSKALTRLPVSGTVRKHVGTLHQCAIRHARSLSAAVVLIMRTVARGRAGTCPQDRLGCW